MDARRLDGGQIEPASHSPRSRVDGLMHNCGHDAHGAILLGTLASVASNRSDYRGTIVFVFQPAEEVRGGADDIVESGILGRLRVQAIFALHAVSGLAVGEVSLGLGTPMAGSTTFQLVLNGRGTHVMNVHQGSDLAVVAARFVETLATMPAHGWDVANRPAIIAVTRINSAEGPINNTPTQVTIKGSIRAFEPLDRVPTDGGQALQSIIRERIVSLATSYGITAELTFEPGAPPMENSADLTSTLVPLLGREPGFRLTTSRERYMAAEDFAFYTQAIPALYFGLGVARNGLGNVGPHNLDFTIHPASLDVGIGFITSLARVATHALPERAVAN